MVLVFLVFLPIPLFLLFLRNPFSDFFFLFMLILGKPKLYYLGHTGYLSLIH
ncbi:uncharacterized protein BDV17DRAFT_249559 [Aspergillus undulatus]|uniref:uncharacterized protein n=1 Tax=Aspergillus undulatus TaxID=1810928 RepID=UPI003CCC977A